MTFFPSNMQVQIVGNGGSVTECATIGTVADGEVVRHDGRDWLVLCRTESGAVVEAVT
jgi:hypothetical protein